MGISLYMAMTAAEISACKSLPGDSAYMACHFSPYGTGLSNIPEQLPEGSLLLLNDRTPICGHDASLIQEQLESAAERLHCSAILLDFQRAENPETESLCRTLSQKSSLPVVVSQTYATKLDCPVFLSPCPPNQPIAEYISAWKDRSVWLELAPCTTQIIVDKKGSTVSELPYATTDFPHMDADLFCHYRIEKSNTQIVFTLTRTLEDVKNLLHSNQSGICQYVGLWQELKDLEKEIKL